jgi:hypothetical protein
MGRPYRSLRAPSSPSHGAGPGGCTWDVVKAAALVAETLALLVATAPW